MPTDLIQRLASSLDSAQRAIVTGSQTAGVTPGEVLSAVDVEPLIGPAALLFDKVAPGPGERSQVLYQAICLDSASYPLRRHTAMLCVRRHADEITAAHAKGILRHCLNLASQSVDPYAPAPLSMAARTAAAALISRNPALDSEVLAHVQKPEVALVQAAAVQGRRVRFGEGVAAALEAIRPNERRAVGFARDCDRQYSALDSIEPSAGRVEQLIAVVRGAIMRFAVATRAPLRALVVVALVAAWVGAALAVDAWVIDLPNEITVAAGEALTALGILVAVHVLSAELSADRLAGPIARATSFPMALQAGYLAGLALLALSVLHPRHSDLATYSAATLGVIASLVVLVIAALLTLLSRTDPVRAVEAFSKRQRGAVLASGRALGRLHRDTLQQRQLLFGFAWATNTFTPPRGERRAAILARRSGYLLLHKRRLRRIGRRQEYQEERLRIASVAVIGLPVSSGDEVFSLVPADDVTPSRADLRRVGRLLRVRRHREIDQIGEYMGTILGIAVTQAQAGNVAGAERVRDAALTVLDLHLGAVRSSRGRLTEGESVGLVPALSTAAVQGIRALAVADDANTREIVLGFLQRVLTMTDTADGFSATLGAQLSLSGEGMSTSTTHQLLWDCGVRALELDDTLGLEQVRQHIVQLLPLDRRGVELGGRLVQFAALTRPRRAEALWRWHEQRGGDQEAFALTAIRIGASALTVGDASLALLVALRLRTTNADDWVAYFDGRAVAETESFADKLYGRLLGADPQIALQDFARFMGRAATAVEMPAG